MCLILIAVEIRPELPLFVAANRDEYYKRPTQKAGFWKDSPQILGGKDMKAGGSWFGITRHGRIAAVTNFRDPSSKITNSPSRGMLVRDFLLGKDEPEDYLSGLEERADEFNGYNIVVGVRQRLFWYSNRGGPKRFLGPGIYGISNHLIDTPWPKVEKLKQAFFRLLSKGAPIEKEVVFDLLHDRSKAEDTLLPDTGVELEWERTLSAVFIESPDYGTRSSTFLTLDAAGNLEFTERSYDHRGRNGPDSHFELALGQTRETGARQFS